MPTVPHTERFGVGIVLTDRPGDHLRPTGLMHAEQELRDAVVAMRDSQVDGKSSFMIPGPMSGSLGEK